jgi:hypothetical protein
VNKKLIKSVAGAGLVVAAVASASSVFAQSAFPLYYPAPGSLVSTDAAAWPAGLIDAKAETGLVDVRVTTDVPSGLEIPHSIEIQAFCAFDTFAEVTPSQNYFTGDGDVYLECPDGNVVQKADITVIVNPANPG